MKATIILFLILGAVSSWLLAPHITWPEYPFGTGRAGLLLQDALGWLEVLIACAVVYWLLFVPEEDD